MDHDARRRFVIARTARHIADHGIDATSLRTVAAAAGYSTSIITHYFEDKADLLKATYLSIVERRRQRLHEIDRNGRSLRDAMLALLPLDDETRLEWRVYCAFLGAAIGVAGLDGIQSDAIAHTVALIEGIVRREHDAGHARFAFPPEAVADFIVSHVSGIGVRAVAGPAGRDIAALIDQAEQALALLRID